MLFVSFLSFFSGQTPPRQDHLQRQSVLLPSISGGQKEEAKPSPAGAFNPYGVTDEHWLKAGKRSAVNPRSGNRSQTFSGQ